MKPKTLAVEYPVFSTDGQPTPTLTWAYGDTPQTDTKISVALLSSDYTPAYQWYQATTETGVGTAITGTTTTSYEVSSGSAAEGGLNAGTYYYYCVATYKDGEKPVQSASDRCKVTVERREVTLTWSNKVPETGALTPLVYNGSPQVPTATVGNVIEGETCTVTLTDDSAKTDANTEATPEYTATADSLSNANYKLPNVKTQAFTIAPKSIEGAVIALGGADNLTYDGNEHTVTVDSVKLDGKDLAADTEYTVSGGLKGTDAQTYTVTVTGAGNYAGEEARDWAIAKAVPVLTPPTASEITYGQTLANSTLSGGEAKREKDTVKGEFTWKEKGTAPTVADSEKTAYTVVFTPSDTVNYVTVQTEITLKVNKAESWAATLTPGDRTYDGTEQPLVSVDESTLVGGDMQYALGTDTEATYPYGAAIPKATDIRTYYVWYMVKGYANHLDTKAVRLPVTIYPSDKTALNKAIESAVEYYDTIKDTPAYRDIAATLNSAIEAARAVAQNDNVDKSTVDKAMSDIIDALVKAKTAVEKMIADEPAAKRVIDAINALPDPAGINDKAAVEAARAAFEALTADQKALVPADALNRLTAAEAQVRAAEDEAARKKKAEDAAAAQAVVDAIKALPAKAGLNDKAAVEAARAAFEALTADQKGLVPADALNRLTAAEAQVRAAEQQAKDAAAAQRVIDAINVLPAKVDLDDKAAVQAARKAYDALTDAQKKLVPKNVLKKLVEAEARIREEEEAGSTISITKCNITVKDRVYTGKAVKKPVVKVMYDGKKLKEGRDYTVAYNKKTRNIGTHKLVVNGKGKYTGKKALKYRINPEGTAFTGLSADSHRAFLKWKQKKDIRGYQIEYSLKKNFSGGKKITIRDRKAVNYVISELQSGKTYYMRIRTFTKAKGKAYYSAWSKTGTVKTGSEADNAAQRVEGESPELGAGVSLPGVDGMIDIWVAANDGEMEIVME